MRLGQVIQLITITLLAIGLIMVHSAGMTIGHANAATHPLAWINAKQFIYAALAIGGMLFASKLDVPSILARPGMSNPIWLLFFLALGSVGLAFIPGIGKSVNGSSRWLYIGPASLGLSFQPSELIKLLMVGVMAIWCGRRQAVMHRFWRSLFPALLLIAVACGLIGIADLGTAILIASVAVFLLLAGGARIWQMALTIPLAAAAGLTFLIMHSPYRISRLMAFLDPWADPRNTGYHPIQSMLAIAMGGPMGRGLGNGIQKFGYLPEDTTDFVFSIICEELGLAGAAMVIGLFLALLWIGLGIVKQCKTMVSRLFALGILLTIGLQALINLAVVTVLVPTKGIALPLVSSGGTGWILTAFGLGLLVALDRANALDLESDRPIDIDIDTATNTTATSEPSHHAPLLKAAV